MAELLIMANSNSHSDPIKDIRGCYKKGDIVDVQPDGFQWGKEECPPRFHVVKIKGLDFKEAKYLMEPQLDIDNITIICRRAHQLDLESFKGDLTQEIDLKNIKKDIKHKKSGKALE